MQGHKQFTDKVVLRFRLSKRVPKQKLYHSAFVKANASLEYLCQKQPAELPAPVLQVASRVEIVTPLALAWPSPYPGRP